MNRTIGTILPMGVPIADGFRRAVAALRGHVNNAMPAYTLADLALPVQSQEQPDTHECVLLFWMFDGGVVEISAAHVAWYRVGASFGTGEPDQWLVDWLNPAPGKNRFWETGTPPPHFGEIPRTVLLRCIDCGGDIPVPEYATTEGDLIEPLCATCGLIRKASGGR